MNKTEIKRGEYTMNSLVFTPDRNKALTTGWGNTEMNLVEVRLCYSGIVKVYHRNGIIQINGQIDK
jgi:hypothetical protein